MTSDTAKLKEALRGHEQVDEDSIMVMVSRQACDDALAEIERLEAQRNSYKRIAEDAAKVERRNRELRAERDEAVGLLRSCVDEYPVASGKTKLMGEPKRGYGSLKAARTFLAKHKEAGADG